MKKIITTSTNVAKAFAKEHSFVVNMIDDILFNERNVERSEKKTFFRRSNYIKDDGTIENIYKITGAGALLLVSLLSNK